MSNRLLAEFWIKTLAPRFEAETEAFGENNREHHLFNKAVKMKSF